MTADIVADNAVQIVQLRRSLLITRLVAAMLFALTWGTLAYFHWFTHDEVRRVIVSNSFGETAELSGDGLTFRSAAGTPLVWLTATQRPVLAMGLGTGPLYIALGVETLGNPPHGYITLHGETREGKLTPEGFK